MSGEAENAADNNTGRSEMSELDDEPVLTAVENYPEPWARIPESVLFDTRLSDRAVRLFGVVQRHINRDSALAWPGQDRLAELLDCSQDSVRRALAELVELGLLRSQRRGLGRTNLYTLVWPQRSPDVAPVRVPEHAPVRVLEPAPVRVKRERVKRELEEREDLGTDQLFELTVQEQSAAASLPQQPRDSKPVSVKKDALFESIARECGMSLDNLTRAARGQLNNAAKQLREIGATPEQVSACAATYRLKWPRMDLTPAALAKHWPQLMAEPPRLTEWGTLDE